MICTECSSDLSDTAVYCNKCGAKNRESKLDTWNNEYFRVGDFDMNLHPLTRERCMEFGYDAYNKDAFYEALEYYKHAMSFENEDLTRRSVLWDQIAICYGMIEDYEKALVYLNYAITADPTNYTAIENRANLYIKVENIKSAVEDMEFLHNRKAPLKFQTWYNLGITYENLKDYKNAKLAYQIAINAGCIEAKKDLEEVIKKTTKV